MKRFAIPPSALGCLGAVSLFASIACDVRLSDPIDDVSVWRSRVDCEELLEKRVMSQAAPRVGTWNIRFFPDGIEGAEEADGDTDVAWVACAIASMDVHLLLVQEFKNTEKGLVKQQELIDALNEHTGGDWRLNLATCEPAELQHPGFLCDAKRVTASNIRDVAVLNPKPECSNAVSPGLAGYFSFAGGGPDFHAVVVHMHAGGDQSSVDFRAATIAAMPGVIEEALALVPDTDIVFAGDFNTSGCEECSPTLSSEHEIADIAQTVAAFDPALTLLPATETCSREDGSDSHLMDHIVVSASMTEVPSGSVAHVGGICEEIDCDRNHYVTMDARDDLTDHCPVLLDLSAVDED